MAWSRYASSALIYQRAVEDHGLVKEKRRDSDGDRFVHVCEDSYRGCSDEAEQVRVDNVHRRRCKRKGGKGSRK